MVMMKAARVRELAHHFEEGRRGDTNFSAGLFRLVMKADPENRERLRAGFPDEVAFHEAWMAIDNGELWVDRHLSNRLVAEDYEDLGALIGLIKAERSPGR